MTDTIPTGTIRGAHNILAFKNARGPRYAITGTIRSDEFYGSYAATSEQAEAEGERMCSLGYYSVQIKQPETAVDLFALAKKRAAAREAERVATSILRAGVLRRAEQMQEEGGEVNESALAREASVDRMTIRQWLGK